MYSENRTSQLHKMWMTASEETKSAIQLSSKYTYDRQGIAMEKKLHEK